MYVYLHVVDKMSVYDENPDHDWDQAFPIEFQSEKCVKEMEC